MLTPSPASAFLLASSLNVHFEGPKRKQFLMGRNGQPFQLTKIDIAPRRDDVVMGQLVTLFAMFLLAGCTPMTHPRATSTKEAPENQQNDRNIARVRISSGATIVASIPRMIIATHEGELLKWDYAVTFRCRGKVSAVVERIGTRYVDAHGDTWTGSGGEWESYSIPVPTRGGVQHNSWVRKSELKNGTLVIGFSGRDGQGAAFKGQVTARLIEGGPAVDLFARPEATPKATILPIGESQRHILASANAWKVEVTYDLPDTPEDGDTLGLREECEDILKAAGFQINDQSPALVLKVRVFGVARSAYYSRFGQQYSGAEVTINATVDALNSRPQTILTFAEATGSVSPPSSINGNCPKMADAPYAEACHAGCDFYTQLLSIIHSLKGADVVYRFRDFSAKKGSFSDANFRMRSCVLAFVNACGDHSFVPLLVDELLANHGRNAEDVITCLGDLGDPKAVEPLCTALAVDQSNVRERAARALAKLKDPRAIPYLRRAMLDADSRPTTQASALQVLQWHPATANEQVIYWLAMDETNEVRRSRVQVIPVLIELVGTNKWGAAAAARLLGELKAAEGVDVLARALLSGRRANPWEGRSLRLAAAEALAAISSPKSIEPLAMALMSDGDRDVRATCAMGLGKTGGNLPVKSLIQAALADKDEQVVIAAENALGESADRRAVSCLSKNLAHVSARVRAQAARALQSIGDNEAISALQSRFRTEKDEEVRKAIADAVAALSKP